MSGGQRRLAAIMFTDMVGYTALGQQNESLSLALVEEQRTIVRPILARHSGREVKTMGDAFLVEFPSALDAVRCAYDIQRGIREFNISMAEDRRIHLRVGIHLGDVLESEGDVSGDAVNIASRMEPLAGDGGVCVSREVYEQVQNKFPLPLLSLGKKDLKNIVRPVEVYRIVMPWEREQAPRELDARRVAVLPFANMSPDPQDEYFADGLTEELISAMSKVGELSVVSRTTVMRYKATTKSATEIGREVMAGTILEGSVRKAGKRVRVTVQTIDAAKDAHLWAQSYDRDLEDIFAIQGDIAEKVASALRVQLLSTEKADIERRPTDSIEAYQFYLKGRFSFFLQTKVASDRALEYFQRALDLDPNYALAFVGMSDAYHIGSHSGYYSPEEAYPRMKELAVRALEINPNLAEAHTSLGAVYFHYEWDWAGAEREFKRALELKPNYQSVHEMYSYLLNVLGRFDESRKAIETGAKMPLEYPSTWLRGGFGWGGGYLQIASPLETIQLLEALRKSYPDFPYVHDALAFAYYHVSRNEDALSAMKLAVQLSGGDPLMKGDFVLLLAYLGKTDDANSAFKELLKSSRDTYVSDVLLACALEALGRREEAFGQLREAFKRRSIDLPDIRAIPEMKGLRSDPRWKDIEERMGLPQV